MSYDEGLPRNLGKMIVGGIATLVVGVGGLMSTVQTGSAERKVVTRFGEAVRVTSPGFSLKMPFVESAKAFPTSIQQVAAEDISSYTVDNQEIKMDILLQYRIPSDDQQILRIFKEVPDLQGRLTSLMVDRAKQVVGGYNTENIAAKRGEVTQKIFESVKSEAERLYGITIIDVQLPEITYSQAFVQAVEQSAVAKAGVEKAQQELRIAQAVGEKAKVEAKAKAEATLLAAEAEAKATKLRGEAEASAVRAKSEALQANPKVAELVLAEAELKKADKWNGELPAWVWSGNGASPFFNLNGGPGSGAGPAKPKAPSP